LDKAEANALKNQEAGQAAAEAGHEPEAGLETEADAAHAHDHQHQHAHDHAHDHTQTAPPPMEPACKREVEVEIPAEIVARQEEAIVKQYAQQARVPGFRKGKVPPSVVKKRFSEEITSELVEQLVPQYFRAAVLKAGHRPVSQPSIYGLELTPGEPMRFKAAFEVLPEFELGDYDEIKIEKPVITVTGDEVEAEIKQLQERQASFDPVNDDRGAETGEFVQVSFEALPVGPEGAEAETEPKSESAGAEGVAAEKAGTEKSAQPVQMDEVLVEIGGVNTIPEFTEHLSGVKAGEERNFDVAYPDDFYDKRLAGQKFHYKVKVNAIKKKTLPEVNDDFAKELSPEFQTVEDLKQRIRENMEMQLAHKAEHEAKDKLVEALVSKYDFPVPRALVEHQIDLRLERGLRALAAQGMKTEDMRRMDFGRLRAGQRDLAVKEVKSSVLLAKIAIKENIQVSDEELDREIVAMAEQMKQTPEEVRKRLTQDNAVERLRERMRSEKALNFLYARSN
jgi:trigger factor